MSIMEFGQRSFVTWTTGLKERIQKAEKENIQMRPYRGLTKDGKLVYGWYLETHNPTTSNTSWIIKDGLYVTDILIGLNDTKFPKMLQGCYKVIPETVCQFTGLKDKNGTEIYADDKMQSKDGLRRYVVTWSKAQGYWYLKGLEAAWAVNTPMWEDYEVIGNIHQNGDLLEQDNDSKNTRQIER